jgi:hypothetical protein
MTNRRHLKCVSCGTKVITRTAIGHGSYQEYAFPCPGCSVELRYALELDQSAPSFEYTKLVNADWIDGDSAAANLQVQDDSIEHVRTFDSETLVPLVLDRNVTAFMATCWLPKDIHQFRRHQSARFTAALGVRPDIDKLLIHFDNRNWSLFDRQAQTLDFGESNFKNESDRLRFIFRVLEQYGVFFRPSTDSLAQVIRQRINLAESAFPSEMQTLLSYFVKSGKELSLWAEVESIRKRWPRMFSGLSGIYNVFYWDGVKHSLDAYTLAEKRFEELKPFYVDCFETLCRLSVIAAAVECIIQTGQVGVQSAKKILTVEAFESMKNGNKPDLLKNLVIADIFVPAIDSKLRNGIGHHSARYHVVKDVVEYSNENSNGIQHLTISYVRFCEKVVRIYGHVELAAIYLNWMKGKSFGLDGRIV